MSLQFPFSPGSGGESAPVIPILLADDDGRVSLELTAIVDTGADGTLVPMRVLQTARSRPSRQRRNLRTSDVNAPFEVVVGYLLSLRIGTLELPEAYIYGSRQINEIILGRDVLNQLVFTYDGPRRVFDIITP